MTVLGVDYTLAHFVAIVYTDTRVGQILFVVESLLELHFEDLDLVSVDTVLVEHFFELCLEVVDPCVLKIDLEVESVAYLLLFELIVSMNLGDFILRCRKLIEQFSAVIFVVL